MKRKKKSYDYIQISGIIYSGNVHKLYMDDINKFQETIT